MFEANYFSDVLDTAIPVRLAARSFIIPVPAGVGGLMVYPHDIEDQPTMKKGMPVLDEGGTPKGNGIVFTNYTDGAVQAARGDGKKMIIVNGISREQAAQLLEYYTAAIPDPKQATEQQIRDALCYAHEQLGIDDFFNGNQAKIPSFEVETQHPNAENCGSFIRRDPEERFALLGLGEGTYKGPASSPQRFKGNVAVVRNSKHAWMVQTNAFLNTYRTPENREIKLSELPAFAMRKGIAPSRMPALTA